MKAVELTKTHSPDTQAQPLNVKAQRPLSNVSRERKLEKDIEEVPAGNKEKEDAQLRKSEDKKKKKEKQLS